MDTTTKLLTELVELTKASIRLQKFAIVMASEAQAVRSFVAMGGGSQAALEKRVIKSVRQMRQTVERVAAGKGLLA